MFPQTSQNALRLEDADRAWDVLTGQVEALVAAWESGGEPPRLRDFLPEGPAALRRLALVELIKVDLEHRWLQRKQERRVEDYIEQFPELAAGGVPCDLLYEEFHIRKQTGKPVAPEEYFVRFPDQAAELRRLLGLESAHQTTTLFKGGGTMQEVEVGEKLDDFDLLTRLGKGAFASVFLARQRSMQRLVALKVSADRGNEPQTLAQLDHNHIVRVFDQRLLPDRGLRLLYMQYVPGGTLEAVLDSARALPAAQRSGRLLVEVVDRALENRGESPPVGAPVRERLARASWAEVVCWIGTRLAAALEYAHQRGILHRDVKPANVLLTADGAPKLADFNISFCSKLDGASPAAYFGGSLAYMSPEQLEACNPSHDRTPETLDGRSDVYSLGVVLWELLTGSRPFRDERLEGGWSAILAEMARQRREGPDAAALTRLSDAGPGGLDRVISTCLAANPDERYPSAAQLARELELCLQPKTQRLLRAPGRGWAAAVRRFPIGSVLTAAVVPNILAAAFNLAYNLREIVARLDDARDAFWTIQSVINAIAFPAGLALVAFLAWPVARALKRQHAGETLPAADLARLRRRSLRLGQYVAAICIIEWGIAGLAYPIAMQAAAGSVPLTAYVHFITSLAMCGLIAATYPFFGVTFLSVRALYPPLVRSDSIGAGDVEALLRLSRIVWVYLGLAASLPLLAVTLLALSGSEARFALGILGAGGLAGFGVAFWMARAIQSDLAALVPAVSPSGDAAEAAGGLLESFWTGSRT